LQTLATVGELGLDLVSLQVPKFVRSPNYFVGPNGLIMLKGGYKIGDMFTSSGLLKGLTAAQVGDVYMQTKQARKR
jgi:hypothetical protein